MIAIFLFARINFYFVQLLGHLFHPPLDFLLEVVLPQIPRPQKFGNERGFGCCCTISCITILILYHHPQSSSLSSFSSRSVCALPRQIPPRSLLMKEDRRHRSYNLPSDPIILTLHKWMVGGSIFWAKFKLNFGALYITPISSVH